MRRCIRIDKNIIIFISWLAVFLWMLFIFYMSSKVGTESHKLSENVKEIIVEKVEKITPESNLNINNLVYNIRKEAHFFAYLLLGLLVLNAIRRSGFLSYKGIFITLLVIFIYAISDEIHQAFVPGRTPLIKDVLIDSIGAITGIGFYMIINIIYGLLKKQI